MKKFNIECSFPFSGKDLYLLNRDYYETEISEKKILGRNSTYHQREEFKADWLQYPSLPQGDFVICSSAENYLFDEALSFMGNKNGIGLTRNNLFAGINLKIDEILKKISLPIHIAAFMGEEFLPKHLSYENRKICPVLEIEKREDTLPPSVTNLKGDYDWWWVDETFNPGYMFAFFIPFLRK